MSNQLFNTLGGNQTPNPFGNIQNMINQFKQFQQSFKGNPQQQVQELLNSGKMTQQQYGRLQQMANQFIKFLGR